MRTIEILERETKRKRWVTRTREDGKLEIGPPEIISFLTRSFRRSTWHHDVKGLELVLELGQLLEELP